MPITIVIAGTPIEFPTSAQSPNWAEAVDQFAVAVEAALAAAVGTFDVTPQKMVLDSTPDSVDTDITNLTFSNTEVRSANITYAVYRETNSTLVTETGTIQIVYNEDGASNEKWLVTREATGDASITFIVQDTGQVQLNLTPISGTTVSQFISYSAKTLQNNY